MSDKSFILFTLGPVQGFIKAARTLRDLWSGSYLLSYLTFRAMKAVADQPGLEEAIVFPDVMKLPLWEWEANGSLKPAPLDVLEPCIPNRFLAEVPNDKMPSELAETAKKACETAWKNIAEDVRKFLNKNRPGEKLDPYDLRDLQIKEFFEVYSAVLPQDKYDKDRITKLLCTASENEWTDRHQIAQKMLAAVKNKRHFPVYAPTITGDVPQKDTLLGTLEHLGPGNRQNANKFWESAAATWHSRGSKVTRRERLCAVSLVKRFAWAHHFAVKFGYEDRRELKFQDTATAAAEKWLSDEKAPDPRGKLARHELWSGQWLHWASPTPPNDDIDEDNVPPLVWDAIQAKKAAQGKPPTYYAVFVFDGDNIGKLFEKADRDEYRKLSGTLGHFAVEVIQPIVERKKPDGEKLAHFGELVYAGGDDALCLLPTETALACAAEVNTAFAANWKQEIPNQKPPTISGGLVIAHYKEDLRFVMDEAHKAEKRSKDAGRNALTITVCRRSGEHTSAIVPWEFVSSVQTWVEKFLPINAKEPGASDRWVYKLRSDLMVLASDREMFRLELGRHLGRAEDRTKRIFSPDPVKPGLAADSVREEFDEFIRLYLADERQEERQKQRKPLATDKDAITDFITLLQTASFLARGRDA
jgi:CRISPR-associated protein Cmr2